MKRLLIIRKIELILQSHKVRALFNFQRQCCTVLHCYEIQSSFLLFTISELCKINEEQSRKTRGCWIGDTNISCELTFNWSFQEAPKDSESNIIPQQSIVFVPHDLIAFRHCCVTASTKYSPVDDQIRKLCLNYSPIGSRRSLRSFLDVTFSIFSRKSCSLSVITQRDCSSSNICLVILV